METVKQIPVFTISAAKPEAGASPQSNFAMKHESKVMPVYRKYRVA